MALLTIGDLQAGCELDISISDNVHHTTKEPMFVAQVYDDKVEMQGSVWFTFTEALALAEFIRTASAAHPAAAASGVTGEAV